MYGIMCDEMLMEAALGYESDDEVGKATSEKTELNENKSLDVKPGEIEEEKPKLESVTAPPTQPAPPVRVRYLHLSAI
jgi:hypothetical protein